MSKAVLISIRPKWCELIASGKKTIEVRKTRPKLELPFKCYIYETRGFERVGNDSLNCVIGGSGRGMVIGEFVCDMIYKFSTRVYLGEAQKISDEDIVVKSCLSRPELRGYEGHKTGLYGWHISDLKTYEKPKELKEFYRWYESGEDIRPCQNGKPCEHLVFDYSEDCEVCGIDYDGTDCPFLKLQRPPQSWCYVEAME